MPQVTDYHVDNVLTNMSVAYHNDDLIAEKIFPRLEVPGRTGFYYTFDKSKFRIENSERTGVSRAKRVSYGMTKTAFGPLLEQSLEEAIEYEVRDTYPTPHDARVDATEDVSERLDLGHEKAVADIAFSATYITNNVTLSGTDQWSDYANSDPFSDIQTGIDAVKAASVMMPNTMVIGYEVWAKLRHHPDLLGRLSVANIRVLTPQLLADLIGIKQVLIGGAMHNTAVEGQADSLGYVWGKNCLLAYIAPKVGLKKLSLGYTLQVKGARYIDRWDEKAVKAEFVRANDYYQAKTVAVEAGYLIVAAIA